MAAIEKYNSPAKTQRIGNDSIYGNGGDGNVTITSNVTLSRDMYYDNLTINLGGFLNTNGYKVFVKNTFTHNGGIGIPNGTSVIGGTLKGTANIASNTVNSLGGNASGTTYTASQVPSGYVQNIENILIGGYVNSSGVFSFFEGGAGGEDGVAGTVTPAANGTGAGPAPTSWPGQAGALPNRNVLSPGGPGSQGFPGINGTAGSTPPAAVKGNGGIGGGVVIICAKTITGFYGLIWATGSNGTAGGPAATGSSATPGAPGQNGVHAPSASIAHYTQNHAHYITGDGTHGPHASIGSSPTYPLGLPHSGHTPATWAPHAHGTWAYTSHDATPLHPANSHHGSNPHHGHASTSHTPAGADSSFFHQNGIDHTAGGQLGHSGAVAHNTNHTSSPQGHNHYHETDHHHYALVKGGHACCESASRTRHDLFGYHSQGRARNGGATAHVGHRSYPGGLGGPGGVTGTPGTNGSTTAGTSGKSGGGGGIIIVSDDHPFIPGISEIYGGTDQSGTAASGSVWVITNT